jgi:hypothetical protein
LYSGVLCVLEVSMSYAAVTPIACKAGGAIDIIERRMDSIPDW